MVKPHSCVSSIMSDLPETAVCILHRTQCRGYKGRLTRSGACVAGIIYFVLSLKKGMYMYQFGQYAWTHMILLVVFVPSSFFVSNIFEGIIWFLLPVSLIIVNDISAYMAGEVQIVCLPVCADWYSHCVTSPPNCRTNGIGVAVLCVP